MFKRSIILSNYEECIEEKQGYYQEVVFINKKDVESYTLDTNQDYSINTHLEPIVWYHLNFRLKNSKQGYRFKNSMNGQSVKAYFESVTKEKKYKHHIELNISGVNEHKKHLLNQFAISDQYFAVVQHLSGLVEVYGFFTGLQLDNYTYNGKETLKFTSASSDNYMPLIYQSNNPNEDFENGFYENRNIKAEFNPDYNKDYTTDI